MRKFRHDHSFSVVPGKVTVMAGPNGVGKTTYLQDVAASEVSKRVAYFGSDLVLEFPLTVEEVLKISAPLRLEEALEFWELQSFRHRRVSTLSGGERQRVVLARAYAQNPETVLLDETLSKIDIASLPEIARKLIEWAQSGRSILLVSHDLPFALAYFDEWILMGRDSQWLRGSLHQLCQDRQFEKVFGGGEVQVTFMPGEARPRFSFKSKTSSQRYETKLK